eukprot:scaffold755_cov83-Skeletonema_dohrnii-CCMP3373.AAC.3
MTMVSPYYQLAITCVSVATHSNYAIGMQVQVLLMGSSPLVRSRDMTTKHGSVALMKSNQDAVASLQVAVDPKGQQITLP